MAKQKIKLFTELWFLNLYKRNIVYFLGDSQTFQKYLLKKYKTELEISKDCNGKAFIFNYKKQDVYGIWLEKLEYSTLAHEATHLAAFILNDIGSECDKNDEVFAYLVGYIVRDFLNSYKLWKKRQKHK